MADDTVHFIQGLDVVRSLRTLRDPQRDWLKLSVWLNF
jgi:hypothetical protein